MPAALRIAAFIALCLTSSLASAAELFVNASYVVTLRGTNIASGTIGLNIDGDRYRMSVDGTVIGLASLVASGTAIASSAGRVRGNELRSDYFALTTRTEDEAFTVEYQASGGNVTGERVIPPLTAMEGRVELRNSDRRGVNDPLAAFVVRTNGFGPEVCNRKLELFTGIERFDMQMSFNDNQEATSQRTGYQGPVVLCNLNYKPIAGHFTNSESTEYLKTNQRMLIWYAPLGREGLSIPYRILIGTAFGDLSMVLTGLTGL